MMSFAPSGLARTTSLILAFLLSVQATASPPPAHYRIGTGSLGATFYPMMEALCRHINGSQLDFTCEAVATPGSDYNLEALESGVLDLGLSQANLQYLASQGVPPFANPYVNIRTVAPLHQEVFILAVLPGSEVLKLADLKGRRINIGNVGSGSRLITERLFQFMGWDLSEFEIHSRKSADLPELLCNRMIDAAIYSTGHPNRIYQQLLGQCGVKLLDFWNKDIARFVAANQEYVPAVISGNTYPHVPEEKRGFGVQVLLSAHRELPAAHVAEIIETLVDSREVLEDLSPIYGTVNAAAALHQPAAPYHEGVRLYFKTLELERPGDLSIPED